MDTLLRVNMSALTVTREELPAQWKQYGGRVLTDAITYAEVPPMVDPLGPDNKLVVAPGYFSGSAMPNAGRVSVGGKSPLTGGIKESNSGGQMGHTLARLGIAAVIFEGKPANEEARYVLVIEPSGEARLDRHDELALKKVYETCDALAATREEGDRFALAIVGPAAEYGSHSAGIAMTDRDLYPNRFAGRGGMGAVMASKGIKAILASDKGISLRQPANKEAFGKAAKAFSDALVNHPVSGQGLPAYGTNVLMNILNEAGGLPTRNFHDGRFEGADAISGERQRELTLERSANEDAGKKNTSHPCSSGCVVKCSRYWLDKDGNYVTKGPEYETAWAFGADCGVDDLDDVGYLDRLCGELGLDTIETGNAMAVYMDAGQLEFGDSKGAIKTLEGGLTDEALRVIWDGANAVADKFGVTHRPTVKGQSMPAYDPRSVRGIGVTYATTPMGADHTAGYTITSNILGVGGTVDPLSQEGQVELSSNLQVATAMLDSFGLCIFVAFAVLDDETALPAICDMASAFTGDTWTADDLMEIGKEALTFERFYNEKAGFTAADDRLPDWAYDEPVTGHEVIFDIPDEELQDVFAFVPETAAKMGL